MQIGFYFNQSRCIGCYTCVYACSKHLSNTVNPSKAAVFIKVDRTVANPFTILLCRFCTDPECASACSYNAIQPMLEGGITLVAPDKCKNECKTYDCVKSCQFKALALDPQNRAPILCDKCGDCAKYCPHDVFSYTENGGDLKY